MVLPENERLQPSEAADAYSADWERRAWFTEFPRPQCETQRQIDQVSDILERARLVRHSRSRTGMRGTSAEYLHSTIEIKVNPLSDETKSLLSEQLADLPNALEELGGAGGKLVLSYASCYFSPKHSDASAWISVFTGASEEEDVDEGLSQAPDTALVCFGLESQSGRDRFCGEYNTILLALKSLLLEGAPGSNEAQLTNQQFMTLLVLLFMGHDLQDGDEHYKNNFAGYFSSPDHLDPFYP